MTENLKVTVATSQGVACNEDFANALIEQFVAESDVAPLTQKSYRACLKVFADWLAGRGDSGELTEAVIIDYRELLKSTRATTTARLYFSRAKAFCSWLTRRGYIARNVADGLKNIKGDNSKHNRDALTAEEIARALAAITGDTLKAKRDRAIIALLTCGVRSIELVRCDVGDIEKRGGRWTARVWGKARAGKVDSINLPDEVKALIDEYLKARGKTSSKAPLFQSTSRRNRNARLQTQAISRLAKSTLRKIGIDSRRLTAHSFRHSNASIALDAGVDLDDVALNLRHKSTETTAIYRHDSKILRNNTNSIVFGEILKKLKFLNAKLEVLNGKNS